MNFYRNQARVLPGLLLLVAPVSAASIGSGIGRADWAGYGVALVVAALVTGLALHVHKMIQTPFLWVETNEVFCTTLFGQRYTVRPEDYSLIVSDEWVGFRRHGAGDITLDRQDFRRGQWSVAVEELEALPFATVIRGESRGKGRV